MPCLKPSRLAAAQFIQLAGMHAVRNMGAPAQRRVGRVAVLAAPLGRGALAEELADRRLGRLHRQRRLRGAGRPCPRPAAPWLAGGRVTGGPAERGQPGCQPRCSCVRKPQSLLSQMRCKQGVAQGGWVVMVAAGACSRLKWVTTGCATPACTNSMVAASGTHGDSRTPHSTPLASKLN